MHEMAVAQSLMAVALQEAARQNCGRILALRVDYGAIAGIMPEALEFCFQSLVAGTPHEGAVLELRRLPLKLRCAMCNARFGGEEQDALWQPCPQCGEEVGHIVEQGRELLLARLEAAPL